MNAYSFPARSTDRGKYMGGPVWLMSIVLVTACGVAPAQNVGDQKPKFAYVANNCNSSRQCDGGTVSAYHINHTTGALRAVTGSPFVAGYSPQSVTVDPSNRFVYVANGGGNISAYTINRSTGALQEVAGSPFAAGHTPVSVTVDPSGSFAYVANYPDFTVSAYTINSSTGALSPVPGSPFATGNFPASVTVDPLGRFAYVVGWDSVWAYTINRSTGALRAVAGSPFAAGNSPRSVTVDPSGRFAYVANEVDYTISAYTINSSTGALSAISGSPFSAGAAPVAVTVHPSGRFLYVANFAIRASGENTVTAFTINATTGALSKVAGSPFAAGSDPNSVKVDASGRFAYVTNLIDNTVSAYAVNSSTGALRPIAGTPFATGDAPRSAAIVGEAVTASVLAVTPNSLAFGNLPIHTLSAAQSVTVTNMSANTVAITGIALRGTNPGQFTFTDDCGASLAAYRSCKLEATFRPTTVGAKTAYLSVNGGGGGRSVKLTGTGK